MIGVVDAFSATYRDARRKFLEAAARAGLAIESITHPLRGREGEELALDVVLDGAADAEAMLVVSSACHGVEGHCGSGVQVFGLHDTEWREHARTRGVAVLYLHALNPWGFSHTRRVTHENVDLNRNFHDFSATLPVNAAYREIHPYLVPKDWPPSADNEARIADFVARNGMAAYQAAVSGGQHEYADGLFYGGIAPTWSNTTLRALLRRRTGQVKRLGWIDLHTGLGPSGHGERILACKDDAAALARAQQWSAGADRSTPITSIYDGSSTSAKLTGMLFAGVYDECPDAEYTGIAMEYGTLPLIEVMNALRADHWLAGHAAAPPELAHAIRQQMRDAFYTDTDAWKGQIISQARQSMFQAAHGLSMA